MTAVIDDEATFKMTRGDANKLGLLICKCGWPENNHFDFGNRPCAHSTACRGYEEIARRGRLIKRAKTRKV